MLTSSHFFSYPSYQRQSHQVGSVLSDWNRWSIAKICPIYIEQRDGSIKSLNDINPEGFTSLKALKDFFEHELFYKVESKVHRESCVNQSLNYFEVPGVLFATKFNLMTQLFFGRLNDSSVLQHIVLTPCDQGLHIKEENKIVNVRAVTSSAIIRPKPSVEYHAKITTQLLFKSNEINLLSVHSDFPSQSIASYFNLPHWVENLINLLRGCIGLPVVDYRKYVNNPLLENYIDANHYSLIPENIPIDTPSLSM